VLRDMIQVGHFYRVQEDGERSVYRPTVKFKKLDRETLKTLQSQDDSESESDRDDSDDDDSGHAVAGCSDLPVWPAHSPPVTLSSKSIMTLT
jgi:hypothetical protein